MRTTEGRYYQGQRRGQAVVEVRALLARLYRGFVWWGSLYADADLPYEQERRREEIAALLGECSGSYLARSVWPCSRLGDLAEPPGSVGCKALAA